MGLKSAPEEEKKEAQERLVSANENQVEERVEQKFIGGDSMEQLISATEEQSPLQNPSQQNDPPQPIQFDQN